MNQNSRKCQWQQPKECTESKAKGADDSSVQKHTWMQNCRNSLTFLSLCYLVCMWPQDNLLCKSFNGQISHHQGKHGAACPSGISAGTSLCAFPHGTPGASPVLACHQGSGGTGEFSMAIFCISWLREFQEGANFPKLGLHVVGWCNGE